MIRTISSLVAVACVLLVSGCSSFDIINAATNEQHQRRTANLVFADSGLQLDVYQPKSTDTNGQLLPVVVFFYGGGWQSGRREDYRFVASGLTKRGMLVVLADYRKHPTVQFPTFVDDASAATAWVFREIGRYAGDTERIYLAGHSAGAHIAALIHFDERYLARHDILTKPAGFIGLSGPYDFLPLVTDELKSIFPDDSRSESQPVAYVDGGEGPSLLIHGMQDTVVTPRNSASLHKRILERGGQSQLIILKSRKHASVVVSLAPPFSFLADTLEAVARHVHSPLSAPSVNTASD